jgi:hypothetical protein
VGARDTTIIAKPGPGIAVGYAYRSGGGEGITGRVFYEAPFGAVLMSCGVIGSMVADDFFGFDLAARKPIWYFDDSGNLLSVSVGFNACVWSNTVTLGVPLGMIFHFPVSFCALEPAIVVTPNFPLTKIDKNTVITAVQIGLRF